MISCELESVRAGDTVMNELCGKESVMEMKKL